jgi:mono/diheme cytochrome c family protein
VLLALSALQKTGLALSGAAFIVFALLSAVVIPRFRPDFPGRGVRLFTVVALLFFLGMLSAVIGFAGESGEKRAEPTTAAATTAAGTSAPAPAPAVKGNAAAGKALFASNGCSSCHTFQPANAHGTVGPDLDHLAADAQKANRGTLQQYTHESIADPGAYTVPGYPKGVMPPFASLGPKIDDLVAFLTQGQ